MNATLKQHFPALTGIRFPLAIWVIAYHISGAGQMWGSLFSAPTAAALMSKAYIALGIFFALSGFLLALAYLDGDWNASKLSRYITARAARILPLYYFSLLIMAPIIWNELLHSPRLGDADARASSLFGYLFLLQGWTRFPVDWNTPAWSLSCEMFFYACLPLAAVLLPRKPARSVLLLVIIAFGVPVLLHILQPPGTLKTFRYIGDFVIGVACAMVYQRIQARASGRGSWLYIPGLLLAIALVIWSDRMSWLVFDELMRVATVGLVLGFALGGGVLNRVLSSRIAVAGGAASFAAYILHIPILWWFGRAPFVAALPPISKGFVYAAVVWIVAFAAYRAIELPANEWIRRAAQARKPRRAAEQVTEHREPVGRALSPVRSQ
jgi:peptidoglycan/LPS O-acetylase OafA/YrhL